ncbi:hypothetical protein BU24DRAFT_425294 [Aaosphaeria arxii CBS 175.79]|uniref:Uncharacterized protein n=1 Tax=Aaosphaeria arxii CBS 175.79 TaxID=1450172 RepID=A0A6A5XIG3_9PLEO|nr:uncharacterized protein BU24DRAFT_425294 [Aaosphaeria arxii CBS 175.79]KAF2012659.1 hypothetical protein BU24DRAFT_425294 [Aaosphaeria arxii CBS 175.79]
MSNNTTCPVSVSGLWNNGDCSLLCRKTKWYDVIVFFLANYATHVVTVTSRPGESIELRIVYMMGALLLPVSGVVLGLQAILSLAIFAPTPLQQAARAGALYTVVKIDDEEDEAERLEEGGGRGDEEPGEDRDNQSDRGYERPEDIEMIGIAASHNGEGSSGGGVDPPGNGDNIDTVAIDHASGAGKEKAIDQPDRDTISAASSTTNEAPVPDEDADHFRPRGPTNTRTDTRNTSSSMKESKRPWQRQPIHGRCKLPRGYALTLVPPDAKFEDDAPRTFKNKKRRILNCILPGIQSVDEPQIEVACSNNSIKSVASIVQVIFAISTLYRTRGNQIKRYGYAAYGLTVTPYAWMSIINGFGNIIRPQYSSIFVVDSFRLAEVRRLPPEFENCVDSTIGKLTDESAKSAEVEFNQARSRNSKAKSKKTDIGFKNRFTQQLRAEENKHTFGYKFGYNIARILGRRKRKRSTNSSSEDDDEERQVVFKLMDLVDNSSPLPPFIGISVPLIVVGALSEFSAGDSTYAQRVWLMLWLALGALINIVYIMQDEKKLKVTGTVPIILTILIYGTPSIGGFVVVGQMMLQDGVCSKMLE